MTFMDIAWMISFCSERSIKFASKEKNDWMQRECNGPMFLRAVLCLKLKIVGTKLLFLHTTIIAREFSKGVQPYWNG